MKIERFLTGLIIFLGLMIIKCSVAYGEDMGEYQIKINRIQNCVTVFKKDSNGEVYIPYKSMVCSTALNVEDTPLGTFTLSQKQEWGALVDGSYGQYCSRVVDSIMIHSVPYGSRSKDSLKTEEYNKLGSHASLGCIRMRAADAKWIFDNCPEGTSVIIYDDEVSPGPLGKPDNTLIPEGHEYGGWDPTDDDELNPWKNLHPEISGAHDMELTAGDSVDMFENITATDICGNDISQYIKIDGEYDIWKPGTYNLAYTVTDGFGYSASTHFTVKVNENPEETTTLPKENTAGQIKEAPKTGIGPIMTILFIAVATYIFSRILVKCLKGR